MWEVNGEVSAATDRAYCCASVESMILMYQMDHSPGQFSLVPAITVPVQLFIADALFVMPRKVQWEKSKTEVAKSTLV